MPDDPPSLDPVTRYRQEKATHQPPTTSTPHDWQIGGAWPDDAVKPVWTPKRKRPS